MLDGKATFTFTVLTVAMTSVFVAADDCTEILGNRYYWSAGDIYVTGIFSVHKELNCSSTELLGLQQMANFVLIAEILNNARYIPELSLGVVLYDLCALRNSASKALVTSVFDKSCKPSYNLGVITTKGVYEQVKDLSTTLNVPVLEIRSSVDMNLFFKICIHLLVELGSTTIDLLLMPAVQLANQFSEVATQEDVCSKLFLQTWQFQSLCLNNSKSVVVLIGTYAEMQSLVSKIDANCTNRFVVGLLDSDTTLEEFFENGRTYPNDLYIVTSSNVWLDSSVAGNEDELTVDSLKSFQDTNRYANVTLDFLQLASDLLLILDSFNAYTSKCYLNGTSPLECRNSNNRNSTVAVPSLLDAKRISDVCRALQLDERDVLGYVVLKYRPVDDTIVCFADVRLTNGDWILEFADNSARKNLNERSNELRDIDKLNFSTVPPAVELSQIVWKTDIWIPAAMTIIVIGTISCLCVLTFIVTRICKGDVLEGNQSTTILLVLSVLFAYLTVLPYCTTLTTAVITSYRSLHRACRLLGPQLAYNWLFSLTLSRAVMILTCDYDGSFMSHINGYLHAFLCFFMITVQTALVGQFILINWFLSTGEDLCERLLNDPDLFLLGQTYNGFLLACLMCTLPFIARSKRNYKESVCFVVSGLLIFSIWIGWCCLFYYSSVVWKDFAIATGLASTATVYVVCIFIPRSYLLMNGVVRDRIAGALSALDYSREPALATVNPDDAKYRSNLYDSVNVETVVPANKAGRINLGYYYNGNNNNNNNNDGPSPTSDSDYCLSNVTNKSSNDKEFEYDANGAAGSKVTRF